MPWKETHVIDERIKLVHLYQEDDHSLAELSRKFGVSRKTAYKWIERHAAQGLSGLADQSRVPHTHPTAVSERVVKIILQLKSRYPNFGAPKLRRKLIDVLGTEMCPAESTIGEILKRHGLTRPRKRRRHATPNAQPLAHCKEANAVWCADFKGSFKLGNGQWCIPLTISDAHTRFLIRCIALSGKTGFSTIQPLFEAAFREYGLPKAIRTDNGPPFASVGLAGLSLFSVWLTRLGIDAERIRPGKPQDNGRHERMHRTLKQEACVPPGHTMKNQQKKFDVFTPFYNYDRPHEAFGQETPATFYTKSERLFPEKMPQQREYPDEWQARSIDAGRFRWKTDKIYLNRALDKQRIGLEPIQDGIWNVWFESLLIGVFEERDGKVQPINQQNNKTILNEQD